MADEDIRQLSAQTGRKPKEHLDFVEQALSEGKPVPNEVLRDYPELLPPTAVRGVGDADEIQRQIYDLAEEEYRIVGEIEARRGMRVHDPIFKPPKHHPMGLGRLSEARLKALAKQERLNP